MTHRFEGRNLEEALQSASQSLGVERWQLTYHVLLEKRGFLGGTKRIVIEAEVNESAPPPPPAPAPLETYADVPAAGPAGGDLGGRPPSGPPRGPRGGGGGRGGSRDARGGGGGRGGNRGGNRDRGFGGRGRGPGHSDLRVGDFETFLDDIPPQGEESAVANEVRIWLETTFQLARLDLVVRTEENDTQVLVKLYGADAPLMIDRHGELLDSVQVLANKAMVGRKIEKEIELDCEDFKSQRITDLEEKARTVADRVRRNGREELLPAMAPAERRIVHMALRDDEVVTTESRGDGFFKRVAVILRSEAQPRPEAQAAPEA